MIRYTTPDAIARLAAAKIAAQPRCIRTPEQRMADDMREMAFAGQNVSFETLKQRGWSEAEITRLSPEATRLARKHAVRQVEQ